MRIFLTFWMLSWFLTVSSQETGYLKSVDYCSQKNQLFFQKPEEPNSEEDFRIDWVWQKLTLHLDPAVRFIRGVATSRFKVIENGVKEISFELTDSLIVDSIVSPQFVFLWEHQQDAVRLVFSEFLPLGEMIQVTVYYHGVPSDQNAFAIGYQPGTTIPVLWTLSEPFGAKTWWPSRNALNDKIDSLDVFLSVPEPYTAVSNGLLVRQYPDDISGYQVFHWKHRYPIATYLVAIAVSRFVRIDHAFVFGRDTLASVNFVYPADIALAEAALSALEKSMLLFDSLFIPYPFFEEHYGHTRMGRDGGMEHQTMTFLGRFDFELMTHEAAHQWFGNYVTLNNWHDIWLNEGFATYLSGLAYEKAFNTDKYWNKWRPLVIGKITREPGGSVFVPDISDPARIFDSRLSYYKAAYVLHMLRWVMGDDSFFQAVRNYLSDPAHAYGYVGQQDLVSHLEAKADTSLTEFFNDWYYGEGYPSYLLETETYPNGMLKVQICQQTSHSSVAFFEMPVPVKFKNHFYDTTIVFKHLYNNQMFMISLGFVPDSVFFDPEYHLISSGNQVVLHHGVDNKFDFQLNPNPAKQMTVISATAFFDEIFVYSPEGRLWMSEKTGAVSNFNLNTFGLPKGLVLVEVKWINGGSSTKKLLLL
jgi:aminopeptidase N